MADLALAAQELEALLAVAGDLAPRDELAPLEEELAAVRRRRGHLGASVVVALAGGTGSGKSSLLNAIAGEEVVPAGVLRPTTDHPVAWIPRRAEPALDRLLDDLGIDERHRHDEEADLAIVDLPDLDSVQRSHRATVDALLPRIDLLVWVLDPQKYNDAAVHELIAGRSRYRRQLVFVLNQIDRLSVPDRRAVLDDLVASLRQDGVESPEVHLVAADPSDGAPIGIDDLRGSLERRAADKQVIIDKLSRDLDGIATTIGRITGITGDGTAPDVAARWEQIRDEAATMAGHRLVDALAAEQARRTGASIAAATGSGPVGRLWHRLRRSPPMRALGMRQDSPRPSFRVERRPGDRLDEVVGHLTGRLTDLSMELGGPTGRTVRTTFDPATVERHVGASAQLARAAEPAPEVAPRGTWRAAALLQTLWTLAAVVGAVWWWSEPTAVRPGSIPWPAVLVVAGVILGYLTLLLLRSAGRRAGDRAVRRHRESLAGAFAGELDQRIGTELRTIGGRHDRLRAGLHGFTTTRD